MKCFCGLIFGFIVFLAGLLEGAQLVYPSGWRCGNGSFMNDVSIFKDSSYQTVTRASGGHPVVYFEANLQAGQKVSYWYAVLRKEWNAWVSDNRKSLDSLTTVGQETNPLALGITENDKIADANDVSLLVQVDYVKYTLVFDQAESHIYGYLDPVTLHVPTKTGYTFNCWTDGVHNFDADGSTYDGSKFGVVGHDDTTVINLSSVWTPNTYTVTFDGNGGMPSIASKTVTYDSTYGALASCSRTGYTFAGWYTKPDGGSEVKGSDKVAITSPQILYAHWTLDHYTVTATAVGNGVVSMDPSGGSYTNGQRVVLKAVPNDQGSIFKGWSDGVTENPRTIIVRAPAQFSATFEVQCFTVVFKDYYGKELKTETVEWGGDATPPPDPELTGYVFVGWQPAEGWKNVRQDHVIVADFEPHAYLVAFYANDRTDRSEMQTGFKYDEEKALRLNTFKRAGYSFRGWAETADGDMRYGDGEVVVNLADAGTKSLYAVWEANRYTLVYDANGGAGEMTNETFTFDLPQNLTSNVFTKGDLDFLYWRCGDGTTYLDGALVSNLTAVADGVVTNFAVWAETYHVTFDGNGATGGETNPQTFSGPGDEQNLNSNGFVRIGYVFKGWATNRADAAEHKNLYADGARVKGLAVAGETVTLYAAWSGIAYHVAFGRNGGSGDEMKVLDCVYDVSFTLPTCAYDAPDPVLQTFGGWIDEFTGLTYQQGDLASNLCVVAGDTNTLQAVWKLNVGEWSEALHCSNLVWKIANSNNNPETSWISWSKPNALPYVGEDGSGLPDKKEWLVAEVKTNGVLKFDCRWAKEPTCTDSVLVLVIGISGAVDVGFPPSRETVVIASSAWESHQVRIDLPPGSATGVVHLVAGAAKQVEILYIDNVTWIPDGGTPDNPGPGDEVEISNVLVSGNKFRLSFQSKSMFGYNLLTNANLLIDRWGVKEYRPGGGTITFEPEIESGVPQMFYKVETIRKK